MKIYVRSTVCVLSVALLLLFPALSVSADLIYTDNLRQFDISWANSERAHVTEVAPQGLALPTFAGDEQRYGTISFGNSLDPTFHFAVDLFGVHENLDSVVFYFDSNKNGDLTDDGDPLELIPGSYDKVPTFNIPYSSGENRPYSFSVRVYYADREEEYHVIYYRDCGWTGEVLISPGVFSLVLLLDDNADGRYDSPERDYICVDTNGDGTLEGDLYSGEMLRLSDAFLIYDSAYVVDTVSVDGTAVLFRNAPLGVLSGLVRSSFTGDGLDGARIEAWATIRRETLADPSGVYSMNLPERTWWNVRASMFGFFPAVRHDIVISADQTTEWNVHLDPISPPNPGTVTLDEGDSYDFATGERGSGGYYSGGDFYLYSEAQFWANNAYQRGLLDLGGLGNRPLTEIMPPESGYTKYGVEVIVGHTYVSLAREGLVDCYIVFRVTSISAGSVTLDYNFLMGLPDIPVAFGDVNIDDAVDAIDVQLVINSALGLAVDFECDLSYDIVVDAIDIQMVINAVLGL